MKTHVVKTTPDATLAEAVDLMDIYQVNSIPVVDAEGRLCGIISEHDILKTIYHIPPVTAQRSASAASFSIDLLSRQPVDIPVADIMVHAVVSVSEDAEIAAAACLFFVNDISRVPVISVDGRVVGTLNRIDICQALFEGNLQASSE